MLPPGLSAFFVFPSVNRAINGLSASLPYKKKTFITIAFNISLSKLNLQCLLTVSFKRNFVIMYCMKKNILVLLGFLFCSVLSAQDDEKTPARFCDENLNKKAISFYEKALDKKKYKKPERLEFLTKAMELEPDFAEANLRMGLELVVTCKLNNKPFTPTVPYFMKAIRCPQIHSEPYYYIGFDYYEQQKNDSAKKYLEKFLAFKDDDDSKYAKDYNEEIYNAK